MFPIGPRIASLSAMIEELFPTKSLYATLAVFFDFPDDPLHPRLIARVTGIDIKCVRRQLPRLVKERGHQFLQCREGKAVSPSQ